MKKYLGSLKATFTRLLPLLIAGASAVLASSSFRHYVDGHPQFAVAVPVLAWLLHAAADAKSKGKT
jgi:hypothetical protein